MSFIHEDHDGSNGSTVEERIIVVSDDTISLADGDAMTWIPDSGDIIHATTSREKPTSPVCNCPTSRGP
jgi:hypothetical protein